jgi:translation initiation factor IF-2
MSEETKPVRLSKVAREFNIGVPTIIEFLGKKGIEVENSPNAKIEPPVYGLIRDEFSADKKLIEKSKQAVRGTAERTTITLESNKKVKEVREDDEEDNLDIDALRATVESSPVKAVPAEPEIKPVAKVEAPEPPKPVEKAPEPPKAEEPVKAVEPEAPASSGGVKVVGKVDLDALQPRKKQAPKEEPRKPEPPKQQAPPKVEAPVAKPEAPKAEAPKPAEPKKAEPPKPAEPQKPAEIEFMRPEVERLAGPTVIGKIELPVERPKKKQPVASSSDDDARKKRKRKRIANSGPETGQTPPQGGGGDRGGNTGGDRGGNRGGDRGNNRGRQPEKKTEVSDAAIQKEIKETLARLSGGGKSKSSKLRRAKRDMMAARHEEEEMKRQEESTVLKLTEFVTVSELTRMMNASVNDVISACMSLGIMVSINQRLDAETIQIISEEFGYEVQFVSAEVQESIPEEYDDPNMMIERPPIVTVMGHVDHGKTSLLDYIRKANVIAGEAGGITQHIGAYNVQIQNGKTITFLDTPGHEAFTAMRARGAQVTDLAIIVIAADDAVMPQTTEAINHAQAAGIPMVFAINKIDKPGANSDKIREQLANMNILVEDWGGKFQCQEISAKQGVGIEDLLEKVVLESEILELKANPKRRAVGTVIESALDKGRGYVCTILVETGTLNVGDALLAGQYSGRVKAMYNERLQRVEAAGPSMPVSMLGMSGAPSAGDKFYVFEDEREARNIATKRQQLQREQGVRTQRHITIEEIGRRIAIGEFKELNLIVKGDVDGSIEALSDALQKLSTEKIQVNIIHKAVGQISESDVMLASASDAIIVGFQVRPSAGARKLAETEEIQIRLYSVIYQAIDEMREAMEGMLATRIEERVVGTAEIRETFKISKVGTIAGCFVLDGKITRNNKVRVIRDGIVLYTGDLGQLKRFKDDVKEVGKGYECGLNIEKFNDIRVGDQIEAFEEVEVKQSLND